MLYIPPSTACTCIIYGHIHTVNYMLQIAVFSVHSNRVEPIVADSYLYVNRQNTIYCADNASAQLYGVVQYSRFSFIYGTLALLKQRFLQVLSPLQKFHLPDILQKADFRTPG